MVIFPERTPIHPPTDHMDFLVLTKYLQSECAVSPPLLLKHLRILCGVPTLVWTSDQMTQIEMCGVPPPPNYQTSYHFGCQSSSTCISECGTPSWACFTTIILKYPLLNVLLQYSWISGYATKLQVEVEGDLYLLEPVPGSVPPHLTHGQYS